MQSLLVAGLAVLSVVVAGNLALTLVLVRRINRMPEPMGPPNIEVGLKKGLEAPDFRAETLSGETVTLADYANKAVSLIFLSTHCPPCVEKLPALQTLAPKAAKAGVDLVLVLSDQDRAAIVSLITQHNISLPVMIAPFGENSFVSDYKAFGTPSHCTVNPQGTVEAAGLLGPGWEQQLTDSWAAMQPPAQRLRLSPAG